MTTLVQDVKEMDMTSAVAVMERIFEFGKNNADDTTKYITPKVGVPVAQGDVNLWLLPELPKGVEKTFANPQLAPGTTQGSRHCIAAEHVNHVQFYKLPNPNVLQGNVMFFEKETRIEHPEHGDHVWPAGSTVIVTFQRRYAEELKRSQD